MSLLSALSGDIYRASVRSVNSPLIALRTKRSMQIKKAASVLPEPVGAEISVVFPARMWGQPSCWGSVGVAKRLTNQSRTSEWAHSNPESSGGANSVFIFLRLNYSAVVRHSHRKLADAWCLGSACSFSCHFGNCL